jgi:hypothetical protein
MRSGYVAAGVALSAYFVVRLGMTPGAYLALVGAGVGDPPAAWVFLLDGAVAVLLAGVAAMLASGRQEGSRVEASGVAATQSASH